MRIWLALPALLLVLLGISTPAGNQAPLILRTVTLGNETGPAYYSSVEQGYRFVAIPTGAEPLVAEHPDTDDSAPGAGTQLSAVN